MARAYARRFTVAQLGEIETFFRTPTGRIYVTESMNIMSDPDIAAWQRQSIASSMERPPAELEWLSQELKDEGVQTDASPQPCEGGSGTDEAIQGNPSRRRDYRCALSRQRTGPGTPGLR